jgi:DNA polymerase-3 subunit epsilon
MNLQLEKPIVFFDLETTGIQIATDRIVEISLLKVFPDGRKETFTRYVNPEMDIPLQATEIHKITNEMVKNEPTFKELAPQISIIIEGCDLAGFNSSRFDIPLLAEEMLRAGINFDMDDRKAVDVQVIYHKKEPRNLSAAYQFYCEKVLENAHSAKADTMATFEILDAQIAKYEDVESSVDFLSELSHHNSRVDFAGFIVLNEKAEETFTFGKYKGKTVKEVLKSDTGYYGWIQNSDFPLYTKKVLKDIKDKLTSNKETFTLEDLKNKFKKI